MIRTYSLRILLIAILSLHCIISNAQKLAFNGGLLLKTEITLGTQNQWLKLSVYGFSALNYGDISIDTGISLAAYQFFERHTIQSSGLAYSYDFFALGGIGKNTNLLGSSVSETNTSILYNINGKGGFNGIGFGFSKDYLPKTLKSYGLRRGSFIMRFSNANHSMHLIFKNDFKIGWFHGAGTDYGATGSLLAGYTKIENPIFVYQYGVGINLFTARPDYSKSPRNKINSDDGRKNVWFTLPPYKNLFYGNLYVYTTYQKEYYSIHSKLGLNSQKAGAYIQNKLHDGLGLNPRFPWQVNTKDKIYIELTGNLYTQIP